MKTYNYWQMVSAISLLLLISSCKEAKPIKSDKSLSDTMAVETLIEKYYLADTMYGIC